MSKELQIRNSTVDFLVFTRDAGEDGIVVRVQNGDVWLTQKVISQLFDVDRSVVTKHLSNIFKEGELDENSVCAKFAQTADDYFLNSKQTCKPPELHTITTIQ